MTAPKIKPTDNPGAITVYFSHLVALLIPGMNSRTFRTIPPEAAAAGDLSTWRSDELQLLIEEGRRKFDQQSARFDRIRQTAQIVLPTGVGLLVVIGTELHRIVPHHNGLIRAALYVLWTVAVGLVLIGVLGSAAILTTKAPFGAVLPSLLSQGDPRLTERALALAYVEQSVAGEDTINTRLTMQWWSVLFVTWGGLVFAALWCYRELR